MTKTSQNLTPAELIALADAEEAEEEMRDLPSEREFAQMLQTLVDPDSDDDMRAEVVEQLSELGPCHVRSFREAGVLTTDSGFVMRFGGFEFQITVV